MTTISGVDPGSYVAPVSVPIPGALVKAEDVQATAQSVANQTAFLDNDKLSKTLGGAVTGGFDVSGLPVTLAAKDLLRLTSHENNSAIVSCSKPFAMTKAITINNVIPVGGSGYTAPTVWTMPSAPFVIEGMSIHLTANATATLNPSSITLSLYLNSILAIQHSSTAWGSTTYTVSGATTNKTIWGLATVDKAVLLTAPYTGSQTDDLGFGLDETNLTIAVLGNGGTQGLWGKDVTLNVIQASGSSLTLTMPLSVTIWGRLI